MPKEGPEEKMVEAFILLRHSSERLRKEMLKRIEAFGGAPLYTYPSGTIIAKIPAGMVERLKGSEGIRSVDLDIIDEPRRRSASADAAFAMAAWNGHLKRRQGELSGR